MANLGGGSEFQTYRGFHEKQSSMFTAGMCEMCLGPEERTGAAGTHTKQAHELSKGPYLKCSVMQNLKRILEAALSYSDLERVR